MSKALLKRCIDIVVETPPNTSKSSKMTNKQAKNHHTVDRKSKRNIKTKSKGNYLQVKQAAAQKCTLKQALKRMDNEKDRTEENVKRLLALDRTLQLTDETKELMIRRARTGHYVIPEKVEKEEEDIFTKEDFEKFEKEYFCQ